MNGINVRGNGMGTWTCSDCGKLSHQSRKLARAFAKKTLPGQSMSAYQCKAGGPMATEKWHNGHVPPIVIKGIISRSEIGPVAKRTDNQHRSDRRR